MKNKYDLAQEFLNKDEGVYESFIAGYEAAEQLTLSFLD